MVLVDVVDVVDVVVTGVLEAQPGPTRCSRCGWAVVTEAFSPGLAQ